MPGLYSDTILARNSVRVTGAGQRTIIFAHGFGSDQTAWQPQVKAFEDRYRCVVFDHVGSGSADPNAFDSRRYGTLYSYASDLVELCKALNLTNATIVAHSVSGMVSLIASLMSPDLFDRVGLVGASPRYLNDPTTNYHGGFEARDLEAIFEAMAADYQSWASGFAPAAMGNPDRPQLSEYYRLTLTALRPDIALAVLRVIFHSDHRAELDRVQTKVHVMQSQGDVAVPAVVGEYLASKLVNSKLVTLPSQGHLPHVSDPRAVIEAVEALLVA